MTDLNEEGLAACPGCESTLGPYVDNATFEMLTGAGIKQVICTTCGMRGPYERKMETATEAWNRLPRKG